MHKSRNAIFIFHPETCQDVLNPITEIITDHDDHST